MNAYIELTNPAQLIENMSNDEYHARPEFSSSQLKDMLRSGAHFHSKHIAKEIVKEPNDAMNFGTLAHTLFLEPEKFADEFVIAPKFDKRTKAGKEEALAWEEANQGKILVNQDQVDGAERIANNLRTLSTYQFMMHEYGMAEASIFFTDPMYGLKLRVRPDYHIAPCKNFPNGLILDVKTTTDARAHAFSKKCSDFSYDLSASMYREGFQQYYGTAEKPPFIFLTAESTAPFNVKQYKTSDLFLSIGDARYNKTKELLAESLLINEWDGYSKEMEELFLPSYMAKQTLENDFH